MNGLFFSSLSLPFISFPFIPLYFLFHFFFWCERFDIYIGFGQGSEKGNGFICGLSIRSGYFLKTHEKKYMYIYKYELWRGFQFNKFESFFFWSTNDEGYMMNFVSGFLIELSMTVEVWVVRVGPIRWILHPLICLSATWHGWFLLIQKHTLSSNKNYLVLQRK